MSAPTKTLDELDEQRPLLAEPDAQSYTDPNRVRDVEAGEPAEDEERVKAGVSVYTLLWRIVLCAVALFFIALFVKAFIDADDTHFDFKKAFKSALGGGLSGAAAMVLQVLLLMPLRTVMNYQYRYGSTTTVAIRTLYHDGGWTRYYRGLIAALIQGPLSRFGDTAANAGILALLESNTFMKALPALVKTVFASLAAAAFRIVLTPIDTVKTTLQTQGKPGMAILRARVKKYGITTLWYGAIATAAATFVGHYPWFGTYNYLDANLPPSHTVLQTLARRAFIGFCASVVSDTISNSLRVVKTYRQVNETKIGYMDAARAVIAADGLQGLFGRGLKTRILANGLQGLLFSILWRLFLDIWNDKT
ncbi:mitochondrial carrier [Schizophyllum commune H4-8]|uniref:Mitochondrial carrier protein n=1 Tax=Schizophyllum commune (strain H4-8 / FGSC 9210) TaxID=578458 RepID=D8PKH7_SCHCM|nr:mitochondrial carrier [Schizophyllum commune H4-8]KAI5894161.1 mitochondrial carrier [Schizophyllum commune H4-8]